MKNKVFFSKPLSDINEIKSNFFKDNNKLYKQAISWNKIYSRQKKRKKCINCNKNLPSYDFRSHYVKYKLCNFCGHLNGIYQETDKFYQMMYVSNKGNKFSKFYTYEFNSRVKKIYHPKLNFINKVIPSVKSILDIGCGAGHFLKACEEQGLKAIGYDVNKTSINYGSKLLKKNKIYLFDKNDLFKKIETSTSQIITMFGVVEHLQKPNKVFEAFNKSKSKYLVISVPTFSLTVLLEHVFKNVYPRQLGGVHTHLYSDKSLKFIFKKYNLKTVGEWWFGTDIMDLRRSILSSAPKNKKFSKIVNEYFHEITDSLQNAIDVKKLSSEAHLIVKK